MREAGFDVRWVSSAERALDLLETHSPDIAILDDVHATEHASRLAGELKRHNVPFLVHTGLVPTHGAADRADVPRFVKPADIRHLIATAACMLARGPSASA